MSVAGRRARVVQMARPLPTLSSIGLALGLMATGIWDFAWAAQGSWVGQLPRQTVAISERPLESEPIAPLSRIDGGEITRVRWALRTDRTEPDLKVWLCQSQFCLPLAGLRGETRRFAGRSAAEPLRLRYQWPPGPQRQVGSVVVTGGQLIVDYRDTHK